MTKNAITVIDQELVDKFSLMVSTKEDHESIGVTAGELFELIDMSKDLIEINAELTKREQKYKKALRLFISLSADTIREVGSELKGDSDE